MSELIITNDARQLVITRLACINSAVSIFSLLHGRPAKTYIEDVLHLAERWEAWAWRGLLPEAAEAPAPEASPVLRNNSILIPTTSFDSALGRPPLFVRQIRPMMALLDPGDQRDHL